jgi:hypothetical protein
LNDWLSNNYNELKNICSKFSTPEEVDDLLHLCIEQFIKNKKVHQIPDKERLYFFVKLVKNQYHSKSSKYFYTYKRYQFNEIIDSDIAEIEYKEDEFNMEWVMKEIEEDKKNGEWYFSRLFEIYIEQDCSVTKTSKKTLIPINSVSRDLNKYRKQLKLRRNNER